MDQDENFCRICLEIKVDISTVFLQLKERYLPSVIYNISGVKISKQNEPGAQICLQCMRAVLAAEDTIMRCQETEQYLHSLRETANLKTVISEVDQEEDILTMLAIDDIDNWIEEDYTSETCTENVQPEMQLIQKEEISNDKDIEDKESMNYYTDLETLDGSEELHDVKEIDTPNINLPKKDDVKQYTKSVASTDKVRYLHKCEYCADFATQVRKIYIEHLRTIHNIDDTDIYPCELCPQKFAWRRLLFRHIEQDHKQQPAAKKYMCEECGRTYTHQVHLLSHREHFHDNVRHACPETDCNSQFKRLSSLRRHYDNVHAKLKRFYCDKCDKFFSIWDNWSYHMDVVHQQTRMTCPKCWGPYRNAKKLQQHMRMGACTDWQHNCGDCKRRFATRSALKTHTNLEHA